MERKITNVSFPIFTVLIALLSQHLVIPVISTTSFDDSLCPHRSTSPPSSHGSSSPPSHGSSPSSHGSSSPPSHGGYYTPTPTPSTPSGGCGTSSPPHDPSTPTTPSTPSYNPTPSTPSNPPSSGGYYTSPPSTPTDPPITLTPPSPSTPIDPGTPTLPSPFLPSPSPLTGTCNYWRNHPAIIWGLLGWWGTLGNAFGVTSVPGFSPGLTLPQALSNTRTDGLGALYREGTASFLNSMVNHKFPYTTDQVRDRFSASLHSNKAAATQAHLFKMANEGKMKPRSP